MKVISGLLFIITLVIFVSCSSAPGSGTSSQDQAGQSKVSKSSTYSLNTSGYTLVFNDPGGKNTGLWGFFTGNGYQGWGNWQQEYDQQANETYANGITYLNIKKQSVGGCGYTGVRKESINAYTYGIIACSICLPWNTGNGTSQGYWPAFWMLGDNINSAGWPECGEIDVMENVGGNTAYGTCHWGSDYSYEEAYNVEMGNDSWHLWECDWNSSEVVMKCDGNQYYVMNTSGISAFRHGFNLMMNFAVGGTWPGDAN